MSKGTLAEPKTSDRRTAWQKYVVNWPWESTEYEIIKNLPSSVLKSFIQLKNEEPVLVDEYPSGTKLKITSNETKTLNIKDFPSRNRTTSVVCAKVMIGKEDGYLPIRIIKKPTQVMARVAMGAAAQEQILGALVALNKKREDLIAAGNKSKPGFGYVTKVSTAAAGSQKTDVKLKVAGQEINIEVKNNESSSKNSADFAIYDKTYARKEFRTARNTEGSLEIDEFARIMKPEKNDQTFEDMINDIRKEKPQYGFVGDKGVSNKSGSIPAGDFSVTAADSSILETLRKKVLSKFEKSKDNYFAVVKGTDVYMYYVGGLSTNVLDLDEFPDLTSCQFATYGGFKANSSDTTPGMGKMRVKINLKIPVTPMA